MRLVSVIPPWPETQQNDALFLLPGFRQWQKVAADAGFVLHTHDLLRPGDADLVWCVDLAEAVCPLWFIRNLRRSGKPVVLQVLESPLVKPLSHYAAVQTHFSAVLTYGFLREHGPRQYHCRIAVDLEPARDGLAYAARRPVVMMNTNQNANLIGVREAAKHPVLGPSRLRRRMRAWWAVERARRAELYSWRRRLARAAERLPRQTLDVYGHGWRGEIPGEPAYRCAAGPHLERRVEISGQEELHEKLDVLAQYRFTIAAENFRGSLDYISEKIIHPLLVGCVPVYLGDENITSVVPPAAFIDARRFRDPARLLQYLETLPEDTWQTAQRAGRAWLQTATAQAFSGDTHARVATQVLEEISR